MMSITECIDKNIRNRFAAEETIQLAQCKSDLKYIRVALANLKATLQLLTKHKVDYELMEGNPNNKAAFNFNMQLQELIWAAESAVRVYKSNIEDLNSEIAEYRKAAA